MISLPRRPASAGARPRRGRSSSPGSLAQPAGESTQIRWCLHSGSYMAANWQRDRQDQPTKVSMLPGEPGVALHHGVAGLVDLLPAACVCGESRGHQTPRRAPTRLDSRCVSQGVDPVGH